MPGVRGITLLGMNYDSVGTGDPHIWHNSRQRWEDHAGTGGSKSEHLKITDRQCSEADKQADRDEIYTDSEDQKPAALGRTTRSRNGIAKPKLEVNQSDALSLH